MGATSLEAKPFWIKALAELLSSFVWQTRQRSLPGAGVPLTLGGIWEKRRSSGLVISSWTIRLSTSTIPGRQSFLTLGNGSGRRRLSGKDFFSFGVTRC